VIALAFRRNKLSKASTLHSKIYTAIPTNTERERERERERARERESEREREREREREERKGGG
jgi:hypothetical protein